MTAREIAKEMEVNYQTVARVIRKMGIVTTRGGAPTQYHGTELESIKAQVRAYSLKFKPKSIRGTTPTQRWDWYSTWYDRMKSSPREQWEKIGLILGLIQITRDAQYLQVVFGGMRIGDRITTLLDSMEKDLGLTYEDDFTCWMLNQGFKSVEST